MEEQENKTDGAIAEESSTQDIATPKETSGDQGDDSHEKQKEEKDRSTVKFPYIDLDAAISLAQAIHANHGLRCTPAQLAAATGHDNVRSGQFGRKTAGAQTFGLVVREGEDFVLTEIGRQAVREDTRATGRARAFMAVDLYRLLHDEFKGGTLPQESGIESTMVRLGVAPKQTDTARQVFRRSADQAGFFAYGKDRLVAPAALTNSGAGSSNGGKPKNEGDDDDMTTLKHRIEQLEGENERLKHSQGSTLGLPENLPPSIVGILHLLPLGTDKKWTKARLENCAKIFKMTIEAEFSDKLEPEVLKAPTKTA